MEDYYTAPSDEVFNEIKEKSIEIWQSYDDTHGYATEKIDRVESITNFKDNWGSIFGMFDHQNQSLLLNMLEEDSAKFILDRVGNQFGGSFAKL